MYEANPQPSMVLSAAVGGLTGAGGLGWGTLLKVEVGTLTGIYCPLAGPLTIMMVPPGTRSILRPLMLAVSRKLMPPEAACASSPETTIALV